MGKLEIKRTDLAKITDDPNQRGSAIVIAVFILVLLSAFVALALSRTATEAAAIGNETSEARTFYAAQGSLEMMTRNFNKVFETRLSPADTDFNPLRTAAVPGFTTSQYTFNQEVDLVGDQVVTTIDTGLFAGLSATQDKWRLRTTATAARSGIQVQLTRNILNNLIPIFQFGIFYNDDMELHPGARFDFGGRVHSNGSLFLMSRDTAGIYFSSRVSAVGEIITDINRNGKAWDSDWGENVQILNGTGYVQLTHDKGSALTTPANGTALFRDPDKPLYNTDMPTVYKSANWSANEATFGGNLLARQKSLDLPIKIASTNAGRALDYVELIKRGKDVGDLYNAGGTPTAPIIAPVTADKADTEVTVSERYYDKKGIRITIADSKAKLPGCASVGTAVCGKRLDGDAAGNTQGTVSGARGYLPLPMKDGYQATRLNGERLRTSAGEVWIKIELVDKNATNAVVPTDVTEDILSLGVTEAAPFASLITSYGSKDTRSVIKLQRFAIPGNNNITVIDNPNTTYLSLGGTSYNVVKVSERVVTNGNPTGANLTPDSPVSSDDVNHAQTIFIANPANQTQTGTQYKIVPFPIEMFDAREGIYNVDLTVFNASTIYGTNVPWAGVMSMVDIDVANLKTFLEGGFNNYMPTGLPTGTPFYNSNNPKRTLSSNDVPQNKGWVVYASDRRGDYDFDGEYDMEDVFGGNDGNLQTGEDVNKNGLLDVNYTNEGVKYVAGGLFASTAIPGSYVPPGYAATVDHPFYRRGFRLIRGQQLPGNFDFTTPSNTKGFTFASENGVYVQGNYNAYGIRPGSTGSPTPSEDYFPQGKIFVNGVDMGTSDGANHVPASVVGDAVYVLSNAWNDANSFRYPYTPGNRKATETYSRFAMLAGDPLSSLLVAGTPNQGSGDARLSGGVHNFKRYLEDWGGGVKLDYCGSLINLYNSHNNTGTQKSSGVYGAPNRNWIFDATFLDLKRLPPGTPYFQYIQVTGFQRTNN